MDDTLKSTLQFKLTPRQFQVLSLLKLGKKQSEIAIELNIVQPAVSEMMEILRQKGFLE